MKLLHDSGFFYIPKNHLLSYNEVIKDTEESQPEES